MKPTILDQKINFFIYPRQTKTNKTFSNIETFPFSTPERTKIKQNTNFKHLQKQTDALKTTQYQKSKEIHIKNVQKIFAHKQLNFPITIFCIQKFLQYCTHSPFHINNQTNPQTQKTHRKTTFLLTFSSQAVHTPENVHRNNDSSPPQSFLFISTLKKKKKKTKMSQHFPNNHISSISKRDFQHLQKKINSNFSSKSIQINFNFVFP